MFFNATPVLPSSFQPNWLSGCILWLSSALGVTLSGSNITSWVDQSVSAGTYSQGTPANQPTWTFNAINGKPSAKGNAGGVALLTNSSPASLGSTLSLFVVLVPSTLASSYIIEKSGGVHVSIINNFISSELEWFQNTDRQVFSTAPSAAAHIAAITQTDGSNCTGYFDGTQQFSITPTANVSGSYPDTLFSNSGSNGTNNYVPEIIAFNRIVTTAEKESITQYLGAVYGITVV